MKKIVLILALAGLSVIGLNSCGSKDPKNMSAQELVERMEELSNEIDRELAAGHQEKAFQLMDELNEVKQAAQDKWSETD